MLNAENKGMLLLCTHFRKYKCQGVIMSYLLLMLLASVEIINQAVHVEVIDGQVVRAGVSSTYDI